MTNKQDKINHKYYVIYKPFGMLSQFTREGEHAVLSDLFNFPVDVYPVGRLDADSEGLLILTNDNLLKAKLLEPFHKYKKKYLVQVENSMTDEAIMKLRKGVEINLRGKVYKTKPATVIKIDFEPDLPERKPPIRFRKDIPTSWIEISISEGKNRQIRKMTSAVGFPTLRLVRWSIEKLDISVMNPGKVSELKESDIYQLLNIKS